MASMNRVQLAGNLTRDPEVRYTPSGTPVGDLSVAVNQSFGSGDDEREEVLYADVTVWGAQAEACGKYLSKGSPVLIEGRLKLDTWETPEGEKRSRIKVVGERVQFLNRAPKREEEDRGPDQEPPRRGGRREEYERPPLEEDEDPMGPPKTGKSSRELPVKKSVPASAKKPAFKRR